ncbi:FAD-dependent oxidoreductase, partial [Desulfovibrio sp. OttesenSCG-928-G11]|nr:FAD-dependent oxidoreductase [Desulfovibrio sp. OttesenSCG-928-G11]
NRAAPVLAAKNADSAPKARVAAVGAGPASLACAYYLCRLGFSVTIFERREAGGGMARYGIPDYRLPPQVLEQELQLVRALGCDIRYGVDVGRDISLRDLQDQGFAALFIGAGAPDAPGMRCEGEEVCTEGYISGIEYLSEASLGRRACSGRRLVVVGGGNVAMDCVRTALRHGFSDVQLLYRRTEQEMPADKAEIEEAREEGAHFNFLAAPLRILSRNGKVTGLVCRRMRLGEPDASGRRSPVPVEGQDFELPCDAIIHAIGQKAALTHILKDHGGALGARGTLAADSITGQTPVSAFIFGGGDCVTGPATLVAALAAGRRAARHIAARLSGREDGPAEVEKLEAMLERLESLDSGEEKPLPDPRPALKTRTLPLEARLAGFDEVELGAEEWEAVREAGRCLRCYRLALALN